MRIALWNVREREHFRLVRQLGATGVVYWSLAPGEGESAINLLDLVALRSRCEDAGLEFVAAENLGFRTRFYDPIILGLPGRDQQIDAIAASIRNLGRAGIPYFGYHWMVAPKAAGSNPVFSTSLTTRTRGGALVRSFDLDLVRDASLFRDREYSEEEMWRNYEYFIKAIIPVAEEAGVTLSLHPDDPPIPHFGGIPRLFRSFESFRRAMEIADSPNWGLTFCLGNWALMGPGVLEKGLRYFGERGRICYIHFQAVRGTPERFTECFFEDGQCDFLEVMRILKELDFKGYMLPAHGPILEGDGGVGEGPHSHCYSVGYLQALIRTVSG